MIGDVNLGYTTKVKLRGYLLFVVLAQSQLIQASTDTDPKTLNDLKTRIGALFAPEPVQYATTANVSLLSQYQLDTSKVQEALPVVTYANANTSKGQPTVALAPYEKGAVPIQAATRTMTIQEAVHLALQRRPEISRSISEVAIQGTNIDVAKSKLYPQISGGLSTADLTKGERGRQVISLEATQLLYDFGKVRTNIGIEEARLLQEQAQVLVEIDEIALQVASSIVNLRRYEEVIKIAKQQIDGIKRIAEIANLRAQAGISSQADPIQAQSSVEEAEANLVAQETQLKMYQQRLRTLLGFDVSQIQWTIPDALIRDANLYAETDFTRIPALMVAQTGIEVAKLQKQQSKLTYMPTISVRGSLSQAINGRNPNNNKDDGFYNSIMLEASSSLYQGGAVGAQTRAASYAEEAARAQVNTAYLDVLDQVRAIREEIENKQKYMKILSARKETAMRTKELYQEQYKLGTRTAVDLLNAEQAIHRAAQEIETARYDIYTAIVQYIQITGRSPSLYQLHNISIQGFEIQP